MSNSKNSLAREWYVPFEIQVLRNWFLVAFMVLFAVSGVQLTIGDAAITNVLWTGMALIVFQLLWLYRVFKSAYLTFVPLLLNVILILLSLYSLLFIDNANLAIWALLWVLIPSTVSLKWLISPYIRKWFINQHSDNDVDLGLYYNKIGTKKFSSINTHVFLCHACAIVLIPIIWVVDVSISPGNTLGGKIGDAFTLEHYAVIVGSDAFWTWTKNSVIISVGTTIFGLMLAIPAGYAFSRYEFTGKKQSMFSFMLIQMFPGVIILVPYFMVMKTLGLLNTSIGLIIAYSVTALPLCVWMLKGFFDTVPRELEEAALLDGCNIVQIFYKIVLPLSLPAIAVTGLFSFLGAWNEFLLALVFNTSNDMFTLPVGLASLIPASGQRWGDFAAASLIVSLPVIALFMLFQKSLIHGISAGAVKG